jgi:hypothetical protein
MLNIRMMAIGNGVVAGGTVTTLDSVTARTATGYFQVEITGTTAQRPTPATPGIFLQAGFSYYDTTLGKTIYYDGEAWRDPTSGSVV